MVGHSILEGGKFLNLSKNLRDESITALNACGMGNKKPGPLRRGPGERVYG